MKRLIFLLLVVGSAQAAINQPLDFTADYGFAAGLTDGNMTLISGSASIDYVATEGTFAAFNVEGFAIQNLTLACWDLAEYYQRGQQDGLGCANTGSLQLRAVDNGSVAYRFPTEVSGQYNAEHILGYPVDFKLQNNLKQMGLGEALIVSSVGGAMSVTEVPEFQGLGVDRDSYGALAPINEQTAIEVLQDGVVIHTTGPSQQFLAFESSGGASVSSFTTPFSLVPFEEGSRAEFREATEDAARAGFNFETLRNNLNSLADASEVNAEELPNELDNIQTLLSEILAGGLIAVPGEFNDPSELIKAGELIRFDSVILENNGVLAWTGTAPLQIRQGEVTGADSLVFLFPWWSFVLWGLAIGLFVTRLVMKQPKNGPLDKFAWIGWLGTVLMSLLLFWLWDLEVRAVWGTSLMTTNAGTEGVAATAILQLVPWAIVAIAVTFPLRSIGQSAVQLAGLGKAARLPAILMPVFGFLLGATLLLEFLGVLLEFVVDKL
jgi:hypothetical protein